MCCGSTSAECCVYPGARGRVKAVRCRGAARNGERFLSTRPYLQHCGWWICVESWNHVRLLARRELAAELLTKVRYSSDAVYAMSALG